MSTVRFHPALDTLLPREMIPGELGLMRDALSGAAGWILYRDLFISRSVWGDEAQYDLTLVSFRRIALELPNTGGLALVAFPSADQPTVSQLPVSLFYRWRPLAYAGRLARLDLPTTPRGWIEAAFLVAGIETRDFVEHVVELLFPDADDPLGAFVADLGNAAVTAPAGPDPVADLLAQFAALDIDFQDWLASRIAGTTPETQLQLVADLFQRWTGIGSADELIDWFTPYAEVTLRELEMALEFPRSWLTPLDAAGQPIADPAARARVCFDVGGVRFSTRGGLRFLRPANLSLSRSEILGTGFTIGASNIMLDISPTSNLPAADADGRPNEFVGVYIGEAAIAFPPAWFRDPDGSTADLFITGALFGTDGISGKFGLRSAATGGSDAELSLALGGENGIAIGFRRFDLMLSQNVFTGAGIEGFIEIPGLTDETGAPNRLDISGRIEADGRIRVESSGTVHLGDGLRIEPDGDIPVLSLAISREAEQSYTFAVAGVFRTPSADDGGGLKALRISGSLTVVRTVSGSFELQSFAAASSVEGSWRLPGGIDLTGAAVALEFDHATGRFGARLDGTVTVGGGTVALSAGFRFDDLSDPTRVMLEAETTVERILFFDRLGIVAGRLALRVQTHPALTGSLSLSGSGGLVPKAPLAPGWGADDFELGLENIESRFKKSAARVEWTASGGTILLPEIFGSHPDNATAPRPSVTLSASDPLRLSLTGGATSFGGSFTLSAFSVSLADGAFTAAIDSATLSFDGLDLPELSGVAGRIEIPLPGRDPIAIAFTDIGWSIRGIPTGKVALSADIPISLGAGFEFVITGGPAGTGLTIAETPAGPEWTLTAGFLLVIPAETLTDAAGDEVRLSAAGELHAGPGELIPTLTVTGLAAGGTFHLGGADGLLIEGGEIRAESLDNLLSPTPAEPFIIAVSGELVIEDGPRGGLQNARVIFTGAPLPEFDLDGVVVGSGDLALADGYLPVNVERLVLRFQPGLALPDKLYPQNLTIITDASVNIEDVLTGSVQDLTISFDAQGIPSVNIDGLHLEVDGLEMGSFILGGGIYIGGLQDIPDSLVLAGRLEGKMNGTGITALAAFGVIDGIFAPLGAALAVDLGPGGIPLWTSGFLLTGVSGGISFTGSTADPDDLRSYVQVSNTGEVTSTPRPDADDEDAVAIDDQIDTAPAAPPPAGEPLEFDCPAGPCPPASVGILYEPHPDAAAYPNRIIYKFSALDKTQVNAILNIAGISPAALEAMTPDAIATAIASAVVDIFRDTLPFLDDQIAEIEPLLAGTLRTALETALAGSGSLYEALLREAYKGLRAPNVNMKLTGTFSYAGISAFLSVTGGIVISPTVQSAGIVGSLNLVGIPVGRLRGFLTINNEQGLPDPALCGDLEVALGPLEFGRLRMRYRAGFDIVAFSTAFVALAGDLGASELERSLTAVAPRALAANGGDPLAALGTLTPEEHMGLLGHLMQQDMSVPLSEFMLAMVDEMWASYEPSFQMCGAVQPKIFGLPLGAELVGVSAMADKLSFAASFRFAPTALLNQCLGNILPPMDRMEVGVRVALPDPAPLIAAGFGQKASLGDIRAFAEVGANIVLDSATATLGYEIAPLGLTLAEAEGRLIMPDLLNHPAFRDGFARPEDQHGDIPSRRDLAIAALDSGVLSNVFWTGSAAELAALPGLENPAAIGARTLRGDYFPHGGFLGAGKISLPRILTGAPPLRALSMLATGNISRRIAAAQEILALCTTTEVVGRLTFYIPLPNPPGAGLGQGAAPLALIEEMARRGFDLDQIDDPDLYPLEEAFMQGFLGAPGREVTLLGIPIGHADMVLEPPDAGDEGFFRVSAGVPQGSWLRQFVATASLEFTIRQRPPTPIAERFGALATAIRQPGSRTTAANALLGALSDDMPKVALWAELEGLELPGILGTIFGFEAGASGSLSAYSPFYDFNPGFTSGTSLQEARNQGGVLLEVKDLRVADRFGLDLTIGRASIAIIAQPTGFPHLSAEMTGGNLALPFGLGKLTGVRVSLASTASGMAPVIGSSGFAMSGRLGRDNLALSYRTRRARSEIRGAISQSWVLSIKTGPILMPGTGHRLTDGLSISTRLSGAVGLTFAEGEPPQCEIKGARFSWNGQTYMVGTIDLPSTISSATDLIEYIQDHIAERAREIFSDLFKTAEVWLQSVKSGLLKLSSPDPAAVAEILKAFGTGLKKAAVLLKDLFPDVRDVIRGLYAAFGGNITAVLESLGGAGFNSSVAIAAAVFAEFGTTHLIPLASYLNDRWGNSWSNPARTIANRLRSAGFGITEVAKALRAVFGTLSTVYDAIRSAFGESLSATLDALYDGGFRDIGQFAAVVFGSYGSSGARTLAVFIRDHWTSLSNQIRTVAARMEDAGFSIADTADALRHAFGSSEIDEITDALRRAWGSGNATMKSIASALKFEFGSSTSAATKIAKAMKASWGSSKIDDVAKALKYAFGSSQTQMTKITKALKAAWGTSEINDITEALGKAWSGDQDRLKKMIDALIAAFGSSMSQMTKIATALLNAGFGRASVIAGMLARGWSVPANW